MGFDPSDIWEFAGYDHFSMNGVCECFVSLFALSGGEDTQTLFIVFTETYIEVLLHSDMVGTFGSTGNASSCWPCLVVLVMFSHAACTYGWWWCELDLGSWSQPTSCLHSDFGHTMEMDHTLDAIHTMVLTMLRFLFKPLSWLHLQSWSHLS